MHIFSYFQIAKLVLMQNVYYRRITTWLDYPDQNEICEDYITYGLSRHNWVEICRTPALADMKESPAISGGGFRRNT